MPRWKAVTLDVVTIAVAAGLVVLVARPWLERRAQLRWPSVVAAITAYKQGPGFRGRFSTYLEGHYDAGAGPQTFSVVWGPSELNPLSSAPRSWVPPDGVPPLGSMIRVHVDPQRPSVVALEAGPRVIGTAKTFITLAAIVVLAVAMGVAVWFM